MKEQIKAPKIEPSNEQRANLSDAAFKTLVIRMLTEMVKNGRKIKKEVKAIQSEIKENVEGTNSEEKETRTQINNLEQKEGITIHPAKNEKTRIQKKEEGLRNLWDNFKHSNIQVMGVSEGEEEEQTENIFEKIVKENFPNLAKEIDMQVQEAQRVPKKLDLRRNTP